MCFKLFERKKYEYGCVMVDISIKNWDEITSYIDKNDIYKVSDDDTYGIQQRPHLTLLYGLSSTVKPEQVKEKLKFLTDSFEININGIDIFENKKFDVVKFNIDICDELRNAFDSLSELPNSNEFKNYKPHITIAYVKSGTGKKYVKPEYKWKAKVNQVIYSESCGKEHKINLKNA